MVECLYDGVCEGGCEIGVTEWWKSRVGDDGKFGHGGVKAAAVSSKVGVLSEAVLTYEGGAVVD